MYVGAPNCKRLNEGTPTDVCKARRFGFLRHFLTVWACSITKVNVTGILEPKKVQGQNGSYT